MPSIPIFSVSSTTAKSSSLSSPTYIIGFCLAGAVLLGLACWFSVRSFKKRRASREAERASGYLSVRSILKNGEHGRKEPLPENLQAIQGTTFSRQQMTAEVVMPEKALPPISPNPNDIFQHHRESGWFLRPFSFAINATSSTSPRSSLLNQISTGDRPPSAPPSPTSFRRQSFGGSSHRFSVVSSCSSNSSVRSQGVPRKIRQLFTPVLPDELLLSRTGERLTVIQSFDDGWCVVGREVRPSKASSGPKSQSKSNTGQLAGSDVELGVVPAWCFIKPVKGLKAERPVRNSSLGIIVSMEAPASRGEVISWSNF